MLVYYGRLGQRALSDTAYGHTATVAVQLYGGETAGMVAWAEPEALADRCSAAAVCDSTCHVYLRCSCCCTLYFRTSDLSLQVSEFSDHACRKQIYCIVRAELSQRIYLLYTAVPRNKQYFGFARSLVTCIARTLGNAQK